MLTLVWHPDSTCNPVHTVNYSPRIPLLRYAVRKGEWVDHLRGEQLDKQDEGHARAVILTKAGSEGEEHPGGEQEEKEDLEGEQEK